MKEVVDLISNHKELVVGVLLFIGAFVSIEKVKFNPVKFIAERITDSIKEAMKSEFDDLKTRIDDTNKRIDDTNSKLHDYKMELVDQKETCMKTSRTLTRDRITYIYQNTKRTGYVLDETKKNYDFLVEDYVANNGNSYVLHTIVPFMDNVPVHLSDEEAEEFFKQNGHY